ncbi:hypothetical protein [Plebeiibacterium marinum]|uniref:Septum formation initiator n=1 Tax=Plebeiibacterium marinum TaxID=2992111 RepID=A0AAE3SKM0_9BACT|nr:hypothetical protein [Plebeiobacterium marinum]MCW3805675.1 hypothetical protein [Plebeiobacterium marinum]
MKRLIIILALTLPFYGLFAQTDSVEIASLKQKVTEIESTLNTATSKTDKLETQNKSLLKRLSSLNNELNSYKSFSASQIDSLKGVIRTNEANIDNTANELGIKINKSEQNTNQSISHLNESLSQTTLYWIIASVILAVLLLVVFLILRKQIFKQKTDLVTDIQNTRKNLEEEGVKLDNKLIEVLESQLKIVDGNKSQTASPNETDHTLALKVADEIIRIQKNLTRMDEKTKGLKQLSASVKRIQDNFASNGYELVEMLEQPYSEGMKASVTFVPDENLEKGQQIITRIIKPQVNYQGVMIQTAQIEVSQGE